jgi:predicted ATPase/class 3 adenylate cyclase
MALAAPLPTGAVTFAFTDIEGSTVRWERDRDAMREAVRRHDAILRTAINEHGGHVFKTMGDAFCAAFTRPEDAVAATLAAQRALAAEDFSAVEGLRVRMALHTGTTDERDGDYFGPVLNRVARLLAVAHGGQVLISGDTAELSNGEISPQGSLRDLGYVQLKDLSAPEHVWQLDIAGLPNEFPPLRSLDALPNNLPLQRTTFVGRERDVAEVKELLDHHRLLTLVGSGGVGKTRLAIQVGADLLDRYPDGVWFVDLARIDNPELVASVVAQTLGMSQRQDQRVDESIPPWLKRKKLLLIFDNCEHVLEPIAALAGAILATAQDVRILATSRQALNISGEAAHALASLAVPAETTSLTTGEALGYGAIALFVDRATAVDTRFALTDTTAPIVAEICRRLDGIALAIELAAARVKVLSIPNLAQRLNQRFKLLTGGSRDVLPRQKTLGALIDWSYDLLAPQEQVLFTRVGIFAGGFSLDAATAVCSGEDLDEIDILDLLASLTDKSLVVADTTGEHERYHLLESTRAYALEKLTAAGAHEQFARRHAQYFRDQTQAAEERLRSTGLTAPWLANLEVELDNYRAVLEWALKDGRDLVLGGAMAGALSGLWSSRGLAVEGRYWIGLAQAGLDESAHPLVGARLWRVVGSLSSGKHMHDCAQRALALSQSVGDEMGQALALRVLVFSLYQMGRLEEAGDLSARALAAMRTLGNKAEAAACLNHEAAIHLARGHVAAARESWAQALAARKALGDENGAAVVLVNLAELAFDEGQVEQALRLAGEALEIHLREKNASLLAPSYANIAAYRVAAGDLDGAREAAREGLRLARQVQRAPTIAIALQHLALLLALRGEASVAARLICYVNAQYKELGIEREAPEKWGYEKLMAALHEQLSDTQIEKLAAEGAAWSEDQAVEEALKV